MKLSFAQIGEWLGSPTVAAGCVTGFRQDSRLIEKGDLFFAMQGERVDGHAYLEEVARRGAVSAVVAVNYRAPDFGLQLFRVDNVLSALHRLATQVHLHFPCRVIGVTGSVGKTTTKEFIATLLEGSFKVGKTLGNANAQATMPLNLLNARGDEEVFVVEMGMSQPDELERLVAIMPPEIALITKIALSHAAFFSDGLEGIARAKAEIFSHPNTRVGVMHEQVAPFSSCHGGTCLKLTYGEAGCDFVLCKEAEGYRVKEKGQSSPLLQLPFSATHFCENFLAAVVIVRLLGVSWEDIAARSVRLKSCSKRFERIERDGVVFINDSYNANPTSMGAALSNLPTPVLGAKRIAVLGAMKELGSYEVNSHKEVAKSARNAVDHLLCFGKECEPMLTVFSEQGKSAELFLDLPQLKKRLFSLAQKGDVVLLKGSRANQLWLLLE